MDNKAISTCGTHDNRVPPSDAERSSIVANIESFMGEKRVLPPLSMEELQDFSREFREINQLPDLWHDWRIGRAHV